MQIFHFIVPFLFFVLLPAKGISQLYQTEQQTGTDKFQVFGFHVTHSANQDQKLTDQVYRGYGGGIHAGELSYHDDRYKEFRFAGGYERLWSPHEYITDQAWGILQYRYLFMLSATENTQWYLGPFAELVAQMRITNSLSNNSFNWDVSSGIGPSVHFNYHLNNVFNLERWRIFSDLNLQLISYVFRPNYVLPVLRPESGLSYIGKTYRYTWDAGLQFPASEVNLNQYRVWYRWDFIHHKDNDVQQLTAARHFIGFTYMFNTQNSLANEEE